MQLHFFGASQWCLIEIESALFFGAETDRTVVGLGGSIKHLCGHPGTGMTPASHTPALLRHLKRLIKEDESHPVPRKQSLDDDSLDVVEKAVQGMMGPREPRLNPAAEVNTISEVMRGLVSSM